MSEKAERQEGSSGICRRCNAICPGCGLRFVRRTQPQSTWGLSQNSSAAGWLDGMPHPTHSSESCVPWAKGLHLSRGDSIAKPRNKSEKHIFSLLGSDFRQWDRLSPFAQKEERFCLWNLTYSHVVIACIKSCFTWASLEEIYGLKSYFVVGNLIVSLNCNDSLDFLALESADDFCYQKHSQNSMSYCFFGDGCCQDTYFQTDIDYIFSFQTKPFLPTSLQAARNIRPQKQRKVCNQCHIVKVPHLHYANKSSRLKPFFKKTFAWIRFTLCAGDGWEVSTC